MIKMFAELAFGMCDKHGTPVLAPDIRHCFS
jgi:hypothetical protein